MFLILFVALIYDVKVGGDNDEKSLDDLSRNALGWTS